MQNLVNLTCYESDGETRLNFLTQWDIGQTIAVDNACNLTDTTIVLFCNRMSDESLKVKSEIKNGKIYAKVPNILLQEPLPIIGYIYNYEDDDTGKSVMTFRIPVRPCQKPSDYQYIENIDKVSAAIIKDRVDAMLKRVNDSLDQYQQLYDSMTDLKSELNSALSDTRTATDKANAATENAISATNEAITSTDLANKATDRANKAAEFAEKSTENIVDLQNRVKTIESEIITQNEIDTLFTNKEVE